MKKALVRILAVIGLLTVVAAVAGFALFIVSGRMRSRVPAHTLLEVDLESGLVEYAPENPVAQLLARQRPTLRSTVEALLRAKDDERVTGLVATLGAAPMGLAQVQELRDAVAAFRTSRKPALAFAETFGEVGPGNGAYYLASAFDEIYLQPSGDVGLTGVMFQSPFVRGTLDKLGLVPRLGQRHEYKNAMNMFTETGFTAPHRESMQRLATSWSGQIVRGIAQGRKLDEAVVRGLIDKGPFLGKEAQDAGLVDGLAYRDEVYDKARQKAGAGSDSKAMALAEYRGKAGGPYDKGTAIALIYAVGGVARGRSQYNPLTGEGNLGSATVAAALRAAVEDKDVKAIVLRVDSPGGSYVASDTIWRETQRARKAGKPVIASMGNLAASGGYFISMGADKIVAEPGTLTGSIGVLGGKVVMKGLFDKLGITFEEVHEGAHARLFSSYDDYSPEEWQRFEAWLDRVYDDFTTKVAEGRKLDKQRVLEIAKGRVWTGEDAHQRGLVDELGGLSTAVALARHAAKLKVDAQVELRVFPRPKDPLTQLLDARSGGGDASVEALAGALAELQPLARRLRALGLTDDPGILTMPPLEATN